MEPPSDIVLQVAKEIFIASNLHSTYHANAERRLEAVAEAYVKFAKAIQAGLKADGSAT